MLTKILALLGILSLFRPRKAAPPMTRAEVERLYVLTSLMEPYSQNRPRCVCCGGPIFVMETLCPSSFHVALGVNA